jgi:hypothetical protein
VVAALLIALLTGGFVGLWLHTSAAGLPDVTSEDLKPYRALRRSGG